MKIATHRLSLNDGNSSKFTFDCVPKYRIHFLYCLYAVFFPTSCAFVERWNGERKKIQNKSTLANWIYVIIKKTITIATAMTPPETSENGIEAWARHGTVFIVIIIIFLCNWLFTWFFHIGPVQRVSTFQLENSNDWLCIKHNSTPTKWMVYELHWTKMKQWVW